MFFESMVKGERLRKVRVYKGFIIAEFASLSDFNFYVFTAEEWSNGQGFRTPEFECDTVKECKENIDSY